MSDWEKAERLKADQVADAIRPFVDSVQVFESEDTRGVFNVIARRDGIRFKVYKNYRGKYSVYLWEKNVNGYEHIETDDVNKAWEPYQRQSIFTPNKKKIDQAMDDCLAVDAELSRVNEERKKKIADFLESVKNEPVEYHYEREFYQTASGSYESRSGKINGGYIQKNGLFYEFEIYKNGYIRQKIGIAGGVPSTLETFNQLASGTYRK